MDLSPELFQPEVKEARKAFEKYLVCLEKTPDQFEAAMQSLLAKAIQAYQTRAPNLRHGIALDKQLTIIISQTDVDRPQCGIYFNLHSPYFKRDKASSKPAEN